MKTCSVQNVIEAAKKLATQNGSVTTLEIKNELRSNGFWAIQKDVSDIMMTNYQNHDFSFTDNGIHRSYHFAVIGNSVNHTSNLDSDSPKQQDIQTVINLMLKEGLHFASTPKEKRRGHLVFTDGLHQYSITKRGYVYTINRKTSNDSSVPYHINKRFKNGKVNILPGQYVDLAKIAIKHKNRKIAKKRD